MRYIVVLVLIVSFSFGGFKSSVFKRSLKDVPPDKLVKIGGELKNSKAIRDISKKLNLKKMMPVDRLTKTAEAIAQKSSVANKLMGTKEPIYAMRMYANSGDELFSAIGTLTKQTMKVSRKTINQIKTKIPSLPKFPKLSEKQMFDKVVDVSKKTGSAGIKIIKGIGKIAKNNKTSVTAGVMYGWFLSDPQGFSEALKEFGGSIEEFAKHIGTLIGKSVAGGVSGFVSGLYNAIKNNLNVTAITVLLGLLVLLLINKFKALVRIPLFNRKEKVDTKKRRGGRF